MICDGDDELASLADVGARVRLDAALAAVIGEVERRGITALLLKGPAIARWLYDEDERRVYNDCDLLLAPGDLERAAESLEAMDYRRRFDDRGMPEWWREHGVALVRESDGVTFDLHRRLSGVRMDKRAAWPILSADPVKFTVGGREVPALGLPARALHLALHAAHHGVDWLGVVEDLERGLERLDDGLWRRAYALAVEVDAVDAFAAGLRLAARGERMARMLGLPPTRDVGAVLRAASAPAVALGFHQLAEADGTRSRLGILVRKTFPPPEFICHWDSRAANSRWGLIRAYVRRPIWLLARAPAGFRAWLGARRRIGRGR
jgi:hypothetical protein